jgi:hypothetical protein
METPSRYLSSSIAGQKNRIDRGWLEVTDNMDELLDRLATEYIQKKNAKTKSDTPPPESNASIDKFLTELKTEVPGRERKPSTPESVKVNSGDRDKLIAEIDREYQKQARLREEKLAAIQRQREASIAEQKRREQELIAAQKLEEQREQRRKAALQQHAQQWLKNLNPNSEEGRWFEEFSYSYDSKLAAAIDYLEAMRETGL